MTDLSTSAVLVLALSACVTALTCHYHKLQGIAKHSLRLSSFPALSSIDCVCSSCSCQPTCMASYNRATKQCWRATSNFSHGTQFDLVISSEAWDTFFIPVSDKLLIGFWPLDHVTKGRNLGYKGSQLDLSVPGLVWDTIGPRGNASAHRYPTYVGPGTPTIQLFHDGSYALNFASPYTIAFWVKTNNFVSSMLILEGSPNGAVEAFFEPSTQRDQVSINPAYPDHMYTTVRNATGRDDWRHIAFSFRGIGNVSFYLNGNVWPHTSTVRKSIITQPTKFCLWEHCNHLEKFYGSLACLAMFEKALTHEEVGSFMKLCP